MIDSASQTTNIANISLEKLNPLVVALPPLAEQHRIVAKVDELMALCDQLEQQTDASFSAHQTLVETLLNALTSAADHAQFSSSWQRIAEHFNTLFTTEESIDQLKQTILQLAVMGKLVPQDPKDEPASELLKKIAVEKARLVKEGKIKKERPLSAFSEQEVLFELPSGWTWARFGSLVSFESELVAPQDFPDFDQVAPDSIEKGTGKLLSRRTVAETGVTGPNNRFYTGQILYSKIRPSLSKAIIAEFDGLCSADMYPLGVVGLSKQFLLKVILSEPFLAQVRREENRIKMPKLNIPSLSNFAIAVPPFKEQLCIVAKVDELMALCDQLKARLSAAEQLRLQLAEAVTDAALNPASGKVIPFPDTAAREARRHAIGCHAVTALKDQRSFGRTMLMKLIYLADTYVGAELAMEVERAAAGPFDQWIYRFEEHAEAAGWFGHEKTQGDKIRYKPQAGLAAQAAKVQELLDAAQVAELDRVLKLFAGLNTEDAEIIATLFAAWNDFLIDGHTPDDAEVIREVREHWTPEKQRFSADKLQTWLDWLRKNKLVPRGRGPRTVQQGQLFH